MRVFRLVVALLALVPILTGPLDWLLGLRAPQLIGAQLTPAAAAEPLLGSQIRFFGAIWFGVGPLMLICLTDLARYAWILRSVFAVIFLAGVGRLMSILELGLPVDLVGRVFVLATTAIELFGMPLLIWWSFAGRRQARRAPAVKGGLAPPNDAL
jgi:hypothetical protein